MSAFTLHLVFQPPASKSNEPAPLLPRGFTFRVHRGPPDLLSGSATLGSFQALLCPWDDKMLLLSWPARFAKEPLEANPATEAPKATRHFGK